MSTPELNRLYKSKENHKNYEKHKPFPIRWGILKPKLQAEAFADGTSIHARAIEIVRAYFDKIDGIKT